MIADWLESGEARSLRAVLWTQRPPGRSKERLSFAGGSRAAEVSGCEHEYAGMDLMPPMYEHTTRMLLPRFGTYLWQ